MPWWVRAVEWLADVEGEEIVGVGCRGVGVGVVFVNFAPLNEKSGFGECMSLTPSTSSVLDQKAALLYLCIVLTVLKGSFVRLRC